MIITDLLMIRLGSYELAILTLLQIHLIQISPLTGGRAGLIRRECLKIILLVVSCIHCRDGGYIPTGITIGW